MSNKDSKDRIQVRVYSRSTANDEAVREAARAESFGSGMGLGDRDISFFAQNWKHAQRMKNRCLVVRGVFKVEIVYPDSGTATFRVKKRRNESTWRDQKN